MPESDWSISSWHTLIEHLTEEIYRVGLERWVEIVGEGVQLLFYGASWSLKS